VTDLTDKQLIDAITRGLKRNAKRFAGLKDTAKAPHAGKAGRAGSRERVPNRHQVGGRKK
jgi:hypothetical protein